jgi:hypothetical protein
VPSLVHTVTSGEDLRDLVSRTGRPQIVLEGLTAMNRHGMPVASMRELVTDPMTKDVVGATLHLPLGAGHVEQVQEWVAGAPEVGTWYLSHVRPAELDTLRASNPHKQFRPRVGTALWLGDPGALSVRAHVLDVRPVADGDRAGYRGRRLRRGHLVVEPPHMQVSMLFLPHGESPPAVGDTVWVRVRHTTLIADAVVLT